MISEERKAYLKKYYEDHREEALQREKNRRQNDGDRLREYDRFRYKRDKEKRLALSKEYSHKKEVKERVRDLNLGKIGWTSEGYAIKLEEQGGVCAICKMPNSADRYKVLSADHEHVVPPKPRGLLCGRCNKGLGLFLDSPILLAEAICYLAKYGCQK